MVLIALVGAVVLLAVGGAIVYPFEMDTVVALCDNRLVATHYGLYNTVSGLGITLGNLAIGALWDFAQSHRMAWLTWGALIATARVRGIGHRTGPQWTTRSRRAVEAVG
ncbi:Putative ABC transport system membrane protein OS=Streptomyces microflavus OX=1919 GN=Smic_07980 PE=4 SV=1 [Streptomyces microflavus]